MAERWELLRMFGRTPQLVAVSHKLLKHMRLLKPYAPVMAQHSEELAPHLDRMHVQFLQGIIGFDDEGEEEEDFGESDEGEEGSEDDGEEGVPGDADGDDE